MSGVGDPFLQQDRRYHCPTYGILRFVKPKRKSYVRRIWIYEQGDYNLLRNKASSTDWDGLRNTDINIYAKNITEKIIALSNDCIPNRNVRIRPADPPWITTAIKRHIRIRKRAYRKAKHTNIPANWERFRHLRNKVIKMIRKSKKLYTDNLSNKLKTCTLTSKDWWSTLKYFISPLSNSHIPALEHEGFTYTEDQDKANIFNDFFRDQTLLDDENADVPELPILVSEEHKLSLLNITALEVNSVLKSLPLGKAVGPDGINNRLLRESANELADPLSIFYNLSLQNSKVPDDWKEAHVCPIHKGGDPVLVSNYRPVSLLNTLDKVFERCIFKHIYNHFRDNDILSPLQSGFIPGDSTVNQLTYLYDTFCHALDSGKEVRVVFCDISKAFDRVWHAGLIQKLKAAGIAGSLLNWFIDYLSNRKQRVTFSGVKSYWNSLKAGVPQGSILGPLLFLLYINDIVKDIGSNIRLFADDTSLYIVVEDPTLAAELLNADMEKVARWAKQWLVSFNPFKTESLLISRKTNKPDHPSIFMSGQKIKEVDTHKHLGIFLSKDGTWHKHIDYIKTKAWARINIMRKLKFQLDRRSLEIIYTTFIRPILEYGNEIWDNCTQYEKEEIDKIQNEAARIATGTTKLVSIETLYSEIGWETLDSRRRKQKLSLFYKMYSNISPSYLSALVPPSISDISSYNLRNANNLQTVETRTRQYYNSFLPSVIREWNGLSEETRNASSVSVFKSRLDQNVIVPQIPKYFYIGDRRLQMLHTRLRTNCSALNQDLFRKNISDTSQCTCGSTETADHFLLECPLYHGQRQELFQVISLICPISVDVLLFGNSTVSYENNVKIFEAVHNYIKNSKRF